MKKLRWRHCGKCRDLEKLGSFCGFGDKAPKNRIASNWFRERKGRIFVLLLIAVVLFYVFWPRGTEIITIDPRVIEHFEKSSQYFDKEEYEKALSEAQLAFKIDRNFPGLNAGMAASMLRLAMYDEAHESLERELKLITRLERKTDDELKAYVEIFNVNDYAGVREWFDFIRGTVYYTQTCLYSRKEDRQAALYAFEKAMYSLEKAIEFCVFKPSQARSDEDLEFIRTDPEFSKILEKSIALEKKSCEE